MLRIEKRERRPPTSFQSLLFQAPSFKRESTSEKKRKLSTCTYETIPPPVKYDYNEEALVLFGNLTVLQKDHDLFTDFSMLNDYHTYNDIQVLHKQNQKIVSVSAERRADARFARWKSTAKRMTKSKEPELRSWGKAVKGFSLQYEGAMNAYWNQFKKLLPEDVESLKATADKKKNDFMEKYPCIQLSSHFKGYENRLSKISFNEKLIQLLGYTTDSFASIILREGMPRIIPTDHQGASDFLKSVLIDCSQKKDVNASSLEYECPLLTKSGYIRNVKIEVHILMNYDLENHGNDTLFVIKDSGIFYPPSISRLEINEKFLEKKCVYEQQMSDFLSAYYNFSVTMTSLYSNVDKICGIKDIGLF